MAPSILAADVLRLGEELSAVEEAGADLIHVDVMDGHFVDNLSYGPHVAQAAKRGCRLAVDCHLMITNPIHYALRFLEAGADCVSFHLELEMDHAALLRRIRERGAKSGLVVNPATPLESWHRDLLPLCDLFLVMSVHPGFGGQAFDENVLPKLEQLRDWRERDGLDLALEIDGGVGPSTAAAARDAGADVLVAGSAIFRAPDYRAAIARIRG